MRIGILTGKESFTKFPGCHTERGFRRKLDHTRQILAGLHAKVLKCSSLFAYRYDYCRFCSFNRCISCIDAWATQLRIIHIQCLVYGGNHFGPTASSSNSMLRSKLPGQLLSHPVKSPQRNNGPTARGWSSWTLETHPRWEDHFALPITTADPKEVRGKPPGMLRCLGSAGLNPKGGFDFWNDIYI